MDDICRLCLSVTNQLIHKLSEECDITRKIWSCLSVRIYLNECLPNQVCEKCLKQLEEINEFQKRITHNETTLYQHLINGTESLNSFYCNLKTNVNIKKEIDEILDNKENENLNIPVSGGDDKNDKNNYGNCIKGEEFKETDISIDFCNANGEDSSDDDIILSSLKKNESQKTNETKEIPAMENNKDNGMKYVKEIHKSPFKCLTCFQLFDTQNILLKHYNNDHRTKKEIKKKPSYVVQSVDGNSVYKCNDCDKVYNSRRTINRHIVTHDEDRPFICKMCGRTYKTASEIIRHGRVHSGFKMLCTYQCGYSTVYLGALKEHERRHRTEFKYTCEKCGKGFQVRTWYEQHQNIHNGVKPFICDICGVAFHMDRYLTAHRSTVHPQSSSLKRYVCVHCSLPCDSRKTLTEHLKVHGIKKSLLCDVCGKTLSNAEQLKFHKRMHLGVKPFSCSTCNKSFTKKFNLKLHELTHTGERLHVCVRCGKHYTQRSTLLRHNMRHHTSSLNYKCVKCQKAFTSRNQLKTHQRSCF